MAAVADGTQEILRPVCGIYSVLNDPVPGPGSKFHWAYWSERYDKTGQRWREHYPDHHAIEHNALG